MSESILLTALWDAFDQRGAGAEVGNLECERLLGAASKQGVRDAVAALESAGLAHVDGKIGTYKVSLTPNGWEQLAPGRASIDVVATTRRILTELADATSCSGTELARKTGIPPKHLSMAVKVLEKRGDVKIDSALADILGFLELTAQGRRAAARTP